MCLEAPQGGRLSRVKDPDETSFTPSCNKASIAAEGGGVCEIGQGEGGKGGVRTGEGGEQADGGRGGGGEG